MKRFAVAVVAALVLAAPLAAQKAPVRDRVDTTVALTKEKVVERTAAAFVTSGLMIARNEGGVIQSEPVELKSMGVRIGLITYQATVVSLSDSTTRVVLQALHQAIEEEGRALEMTKVSQAREPVKSNWKSMFRPHWARLEQIAADVAK